MLRTIRDYCDAVQNDRDLHEIFYHAEEEMFELKQEIDNGDTGEDGIVGEAVDVILCMVDIINRHKPNISNLEIMHIVVQKCEKWERLYGKENRFDYD